MPRDPFDALPPADRKKFVVELKRHLTTALKSLERFSSSVRSRRVPEWPTEAALSLFVRQVEAFRSISTRQPGARPIQLIREMDHRWPRMKIMKRLDNAISDLEVYIGRSLLAEANANAFFQRQSDSVKTRFRALVLSEQNAKSADLQLMAHHLPPAFKEMIELTSGKDLESLSAAPPNTRQKLRAALSWTAQQYLFAKHQLYVARLAPAKELRAFFYQLKHRPYTRRLFGFASDHIDLWDKTDRKAQTRVRVQRFRQKQLPFSVTRAHRRRKHRPLA